MRKHFKIVSIMVLVVTLFSCSSYKEVELLSVGDYAVGPVSKETMDIFVNLEVNNPNNYNIKIKKTTLDLYLDGKKIGEAPMKEDILLKKKTQDNYQFTIRADYKQLSKKLFSNLGALFGKKTIKLGVKGQVKAKAMGVVGKKFDLDVEEEVNIKELVKNSGFTL